jgi:hypothetical protein
VERGVKNWRANLNCRDNTGVPDEQTLLLWAQKCKRDGLKIFSLNALGQDITRKFSLSVKLWILLELLLLQILLILDHLDSWLPPVLCCVYERSACQLFWLRAVKKHSLKNYCSLLPNLLTLKSKADDAEIRQSRCHPPDTATWFSILVLKSGRDDCFELMVLTMYYVSQWVPPILHATLQRNCPSHYANTFGELGYDCMMKIVPAPCSRTSNPTGLHHWVTNWPYWLPAKVHFCVWYLSLNFDFFGKAESSLFKLVLTVQVIPSFRNGIVICGARIGFLLLQIHIGMLQHWL